MKVPFHWVTYGDEEVASVMKEINDNWFSPRGPRLPELGQKFADLVGKTFGWPTSSGTGAIHLALLTMGIGEGDLVFVPSYTCSPGVYPVSYVGATPVFVDCELATYGMSPEHLKKVIKEHGSAIKASIPVHLYGSGCDNQVIDILKENGIPIIEDACESDGAKYIGSDERLGKRGDMACFSMRGDKVLTALGTGGVWVSDDSEWFRAFKLWSDLGLKNEQPLAVRYRDLECIGFNYEMNNVSAAFGIAQLDRLDEIIAGRKQAVSWWFDALKDCNDIVLMADYDGHVWYQFPILFERLKTVDQLDAMLYRITDRGVPLIPPFWPMDKQPAYLEIGGDCPRSAYASEHVLLFPCYPALSEEEVKYMAGVIMEEYAKEV